MDPSNVQKQHEPEEPRFLDFPHLPDDATTPDGRPRLNRYSSTLTKDHDFPGAQVASYLRYLSRASNDSYKRRCFTPLGFQIERR